MQLIYDMDAFSRSWMIEQGGMRPAELQPIHVDFDTGPKRPPLQVSTVMAEQTSNACADEAWSWLDLSTNAFIGVDESAATTG